MRRALIILLATLLTTPVMAATSSAMHSDEVGLANDSQLPNDAEAMKALDAAGKPPLNPMQSAVDADHQTIQQQTDQLNHDKSLRDKQRIKDDNKALASTKHQLELDKKACQAVAKSMQPTPPLEGVTAAPSCQ